MSYVSVKMTLNKGHSRIGILGGGQLGAMLGRAAQSLGHAPLVFVSSHEECAVKWHLPVFCGNLDSAQDVQKFLEQVDVVVFENEFFPKSLKSNASGHLPKFKPPLNTLETLQNKANQKELLKNLHIPTAEFDIFSGPTSELSLWIEGIGKKPTKTVLKWGFGGYDGKGVLVHNDLTASQKFCLEGINKGATVYSEDWIPFALELAMVGARNHQGEFVHFPLVISRQENSICKWVTGSARALGISESLEVQAANILQTIANECHLEGVIAVEFFLDKHGHLLVNEIAPRVHNSGHYTQNAADLSQFDLHIQACLDERLKSPKVCEYFGMLNLIGNTENAHTKPPVLESPYDTLYWYEKNLRKNRKMGHINFVAKDHKGLEEKLYKLQKTDKTWQESNLNKV